MSEADTNEPQPASQEEPSVESPEVHHPHARHGGGLPRWLELGIALTALVTSVSSIVIAVHHGKIMEKLVDGIWAEPEPVKQCVRDEPHEFMPQRTPG